MKKITIILLSAALAVNLSACSIFPGAREQLEMSAYERIHEALIGMVSYQANAIVKFISNKGYNEYNILKQCRATGEYRITVTGPEHVAGNITVFDGNIIAQFNTNIAGKISVGTQETQERSEILVTTFVRNFINSHEISVTAASMGESRLTVLEAVIPGDHPYLATEKLWVDNETLKPTQLIIFDSDGNERIVVTFIDFEYNVEFDDSIFVAQ